MKAIKIIRTVVTPKTIKDIKGFTIQKGTRLFVTNDSAPKHPREGYKLLVVRVDNGTGHTNLCPETCVKDTDLKASRIATRKQSKTKGLPESVVKYLNSNPAFNMFGLVNVHNVKSFTKSKLSISVLKRRIRKHFCSEMVDGQIAFV